MAVASAAARADPGGACARRQAQRRPQRDREEGCVRVAVAERELERPVGVEVVRPAVAVLHADHRDRRRRMPPRPPAARAPGADAAPAGRRARSRGRRRARRRGSAARRRSRSRAPGSRRPTGRPSRRARSGAPRRSPPPARRAGWPARERSTRARPRVAQRTIVPGSSTVPKKPPDLPLHQHPTTVRTASGKSAAGSRRAGPGALPSRGAPLGASGSARTGSS